MTRIPMTVLLVMFIGTTHGFHTQHNEMYDDSYFDLSGRRPVIVLIGLVFHGFMLHEAVLKTLPWANGLRPSDGAAVVAFSAVLAEH